MRHIRATASTSLSDLCEYTVNGDTTSWLVIWGSAGEILKVQLVPPLLSLTPRPNKNLRRSASAQGLGFRAPALNAALRKASKQARRSKEGRVPRHGFVKSDLAPTEGRKEREKEREREREPFWLKSLTLVGTRLSPGDLVGGLRPPAATCLCGGPAVCRGPWQGT